VKANGSQSSTAKRSSERRRERRAVNVSVAADERGPTDVAKRKYEARVAPSSLRNAA
jgi:hypothetical protein